MTTQESTPARPEEEWLEILESMLETWESRRPEIKNDSTADVNQLLTVFGLAANAHRLGRAALTLFRAGLHSESIPTVRAIYEHALTTQWLALHAAGTTALINEYGRNRASTAKTLRQAGAADMIKAAEHLENDAWEKIPTDSDQQAKQFLELCNDLEPAGSEAYFYYRLMSSLSHPTGQVVDEYLSDDPLTLHLEPKTDALRGHWIFFTCVGILLCATAVDFLEDGNPRQEELSKVGQTLGTPHMLRLSAKYYTRTGKTP
ncbi:hypothetical protein KCV87_14650 [Actinosynnema pretiosum subsp. pretiosum]|uniref:Uncharacterized protein n=1 Tax=Actinosynnema pretiosum subsp. pretiosum TaxID=103721 RepID=A0AA45LDA1_9PSEU|nr:hypothetical protein KCV87_14650 [Actinosynnema pretiosum subsp. pretiosum]